MMYWQCHIINTQKRGSFMENMGIVQARTPESVKENATNILAILAKWWIQEIE